jgi:branched-chain amino acid transport system ATP-binding protein
VNPALALEAVSAAYSQTEVLHAVSMEVAHGEIVALIGANGAGKSSLLNTILGTLRASAGRILADDRDISRMATQDIVSLGIALVPERRQLFGEMSVDENLLLGAHLRRGDRAAVREDMEAQYRLFPQLAERRSQLARSLSGGEQQMLAIARAQMSRPRLILLDEPSLGLAPMIVARIMDLLRELRAAGKTILLVEQNARAALGIADRGYVMETGRVTRQGRASDLLADPRVREAYLGDEGGAGVESMEARIRRIVVEDTATRARDRSSPTAR